MEIALILAGTGVHISPAGERPVRRGDLIFLRPGAWHGYRECRALRVFNCCFGAELLNRELAWVLETPHTNALLRVLPLSEGRFGQIIVSLPQAATLLCLQYLKILSQTSGNNQSGPMRDRPRQLAYLVLLLDQVGRHLFNSGDQFGLTPGPRPHLVVEAGVKRLSVAMTETWTLPRLAQKLNTSPAYLIRLFKTSTGLPPMAYLTRVRMEYAAGLLLRTSGPIGRIGSAVGYLDANLFSRRFKAVFAISPRDYRRRFAKTVGPSACRGPAACQIGQRP